MASILKSNAVIDFDYFLTVKGGGPDCNYDQDRIENLINAETDRLERITGRKFCPQAEDTEIFSGRGREDHIVRQMHIVSEPIIYYWDFSQWILMSETDYPREYLEDGLIWLTDGSVFEKGRRNYKVIYDYGYARADVPQSLKEAVAEMVHRSLMRFDDRQGISSESFGDRAVTYDLAKMPANIQAIYNLFRAKGRGI